VVWNVVQVVGWAKMLHDNAQVMPLSRALQVTFSGEAPCEFCRVAESGKQADRQLPAEAALGASERVLFIVDVAAAPVLTPPDRDWPGLAAATGLARTEPVPVPPPRA
jgi:hypothetical protein